MNIRHISWWYLPHSTWVDTVGGDDDNDDGDDDDDDHDDGDGDDDDDGDHDDYYDDDGEIMIMNHDHDDDDGDDDYDGDDDDDDDGCKCGATSGLDGTCFKIKKTYGMQKHCSIYISRNRAKNIGSKTRANKGFKTLQNQNCNFLKAKMRPNCAEKGSIVETSRSFKLKMRLIVFLRYLKCW